jgi:hypothetical protein
MTTHSSIQRLTLVVVLALIPWLPAVVAEAADPAGAIPEVMAPPPAVRTATEAAAQAPWVNDLKHAVAMYKTKYPASDFAPYDKKLALVADAIGRGDRRAVKTEMGAFFKMLDRRSHGIDEAAAGELLNYAQMVTPLREYGIAVPRSGAEQYGTDVPVSGSFQ